MLRVHATIGFIQMVVAIGLPIGAFTMEVCLATQGCANRKASADFDLSKDHKILSSCKVKSVVDASA